MQKDDGAQLRGEPGDRAPNVQPLRGIGLGRLTDDVLTERQPAHPRTPPPAQALAQDDPAQPWAERGCLPQAFPALPRNHKGLLDGIFSSAEIVKDKVRVLEHRASV